MINEDPAASGRPAPLHRSRTSDARAHTALLLEVARRYHIDGESQAEIARSVSFSRPTVSRMLAEARRRGMVQIRIGHPLERVLGIERALVEAFGLHQARVADPEDGSAVQDDVARCAADLIVEAASEDLVLTVSNGLAVTATVDAMPELVWPRSRVVQMIGSVGSSDTLLDSPETGRRMARKLGGSFHPLPAPLVVGDARVAAALRDENQIATTLELGGRADIALVGVGAVRDGQSGLIFREYESSELTEDLQQTGAVAHICGHHISAAGDHVRTVLCDRTIAVEPERMKRIPLVVGVAWGEEKVAPLAAAMRGGFISALVTDRTTALALLETVDT
ncbi:sugar-binding transcriptional regulator [Agromyces archimandritae]|uniref:Sugar-binding domain-containing protein n=1 Tax=Agromyces archimandritae TaxID=2781962 RepID=A0A975IPX7_9MICO|nr:sugar-binding domain-containing protein [Agromyces archimandritae]QTX05764.1 hypothetical protein G127AT_06045 [Agromyces archimandritae]